MDLTTHSPSLTRLMWIAVIAVTAHLGVSIVRRLARHVLLSRLGSEAKAQTVTGFAQSMLVFVLYFGAFGFGLDELGVPLTTYLAGASVIGLAVSFGSQGVVQDVITGLTVVFSDVLDVGDLANVGGQVGIVESIGMRFTALIGFSGERVFVPNRTIANVVNYPDGYIHAYMDGQLPSADEGARVQTTKLAESIAKSAYEQYRGILLLPPTIENIHDTGAGDGYVRIKFRVWPGQGQLIEGPIKEGLVSALKQLDPSYASWMVSVYYRAEPSESERPKMRLPRPAVLRDRSSKAEHETRASKHRSERRDAVVPKSP
ncbi:MAG: mechanosensitive ion channel domain-containing protein [Polyangiales bacterium]